MILILNILIISTIIVLLFIPSNKLTYLRDLSLCFSTVIFIASLVFLKIPLSTAVYFETNTLSILSFPSFIFSYSYVVDNLSIIFIILTSMLTIVVIMTTRNIKYRLKDKFILLFIIELLLINCFSVAEILSFYVFFETILIPVFLIIGVWGSQKNKIFAANQFFLYTVFGSFFMLIGIILLYILVGSSNIYVLKSIEFNLNIEKLLFILMFMSMVIKIPMAPFHLWLPKAHVEAPTTGSILLAGILLKLGSYGFLRFLLFLFPRASFYFLPLVVALALLSIIFSSAAVLRQIDLKRIIAYSSIAHMNYLVIALFVKNLLAITGSLLLQIAHGLSSSALFFIIGILYDRYKSRNIFYYRGLVAILPFFCFFLFVFSLSNLGFPSTINFVSEMLVFWGLFKVIPSAAILTLSGMLLSAISSFIIATRIIFGPTFNHVRYYYDITRENFIY